MSTKRDFLAPGAAGHPDAELIRLCAEHVGNLAAYNRNKGAPPFDDPLWRAYQRTRDAIGTAKASTLEGMRAKARAAKAEARGLHGEDDPEGSPAARWAWDLVNDLLTGSATA